MVKRKRDTKTLEEIEEMCFCYYCEREFLDNKSLQDHMKSKHLQCQLCRKKLDSIGGLNVHMDSVHKQPLDKILNALPSREAANGPEIYLMCGVPQDMLDSFKARIYQRYLGPEMQHRQQTGNYLTGSEEAMHAAKKPKVEETPEQLKARRDAHVAQRRAEIAARKAAEANGVQVKQESGVQVKQESGVQVKQESGDSFAAQESHIKLENYPAQEYKYTPPFNGLTELHASSSPTGQHQVSQVYNFNGYTAGRQAYGFPSTNYGQPTAVQSSYPNPVVGQQPAGCGYGGSPQNFPQQPMVSHSPMAHSSPAIKTEPAAGTNGKSTMPAAPLGLPQRPSFDLPKYSKEDMEKFHAGHGVRISQTKPAVDNITSDHAATNPAVEQAVDASDLNQDSGDLAQGPTSANIVRGLEDLLNGSGRDDEAAKDSAFNTMSEFAEPQEEVNGGIMPGDAAIAADAQPVPASMHESQKGAPASKAKTSTMMWNNNVDSPEEVVAKSLRVKRSRSSKKRREEPVIEQADSQAVTGSVADDIEQ